MEFHPAGSGTGLQGGTEPGLWIQPPLGPADPPGVGQVLRDQDRIEIYRPLRVDPKVARRERFVKQGSRGAGLFIKLRIQANKT